MLRRRPYLVKTEEVADLGLGAEAVEERQQVLHLKHLPSAEMHRWPGPSPPYRTQNTAHAQASA